MEMEASPHLFSVLFFVHNLYFWISWYYRIILSVEIFETITPGEKECYCSGDCFYASVIVMIFPALPWLTGNSNEVSSSSPPFLMSSLASFALSCSQCSTFISIALWCISLTEWLLYLFSYQRPGFQAGSAEKPQFLPLLVLIVGKEARKGLFCAF